MKRFLYLLFSLVLLCSPVLAVPYAVTGGTYDYTWVGGSGSVSGGSGAYQLTYTKPNSDAGYGIGISLTTAWPIEDLSGFSVISMNIKSDSPTIKVSLIYFNNGDPGDDIYKHESGPCIIQSATAGAYKTFAFSLSRFADVNLSRIKAIQFAPQQIGTNLVVNIQDINFNNNTVPTPDPFSVAANSYSYIWKSGVGTASGSGGVYQLTYTKPTAIDGAGLGLSLTPEYSLLNLSPYTGISLNIKGDSPVINMSIKYFNNGDPTSPDVTYIKESGLYQLQNVVPGSYKSYIVPLTNFSGVNLARVKAVQFSPQQTGTNLIINVKDVNFNVMPVVQPPATPTPGAFVTNNPLINTLIASFSMSAALNPKIIATANYKSQVANVWAAYKQQYIENYIFLAPDYYGLVFDPLSNDPHNAADDGDYTTSEAAGYGMLLAVFMNDRVAFDKIFTKIYDPSKGIWKPATKLFCWKIGTTGVLQSESATDADQDIALALIFADTLKSNNVSNWGASTQNYAEKAQEAITAVYDQDFEFYKYLRLGDYFFSGRPLTNISYFSPAWYRIFAQADKKAHDWQYIIDQGYSVLSLQDGYPLGIAPDWCNSFGRPDSSGSGKSYQMAKDGIRTYWRLATDYLWFGESRAKTFLSNTKKLLDLGKISNINNISEMDMSGAMLNPATPADVGYTGMLALSSMALDSPAYLTYRTTWVNAFNDFLTYTNSTSNSYFGKIGDTTAKYNYFNQSLALFSGLMMSGAMPNVYNHFVNYGSLSIPAPVAVASVYNKSIIKIPYQIVSGGGAGSITTVNLKVAHPTTGTDFTLQMQNVANQTSCTTSDINGYVKMASVERSMTGNTLFVTFNMVVSTNWTNASVVRYTLSAFDKKNQTSQRVNLDSSVFYNYSADHMANLRSDYLLGFNPNKSGDQIIQYPYAVEVACSASSWNISAYTDNDGDAPGKSGLAIRDTVGSIIHTITLNIMFQDISAVPPTIDSRWKVVYDRQDIADKRVTTSVSPAAIKNKYMFYKANLDTARVGSYSTSVNVRLLSDNNKNLVDDFEDNSLQTERQSYWAGVPVTVDTVASIAIISNGFDGGKSLRLTYTHGTKHGNIGPQAIALFTLNPSGNPADISTRYKGITFVMRASNPNPLGVVLESTDILDFDYFLVPVVSPTTDWVKYTVEFKDFKKAGFGSNTRTINNVLQYVRGIQFKTLSEHEGETGTFDIDEVSFY